MVRMRGKGAGSCQVPDSSPCSRGVRAAPGAHKPLRAPEIQVQSGLGTLGLRCGLFLGILGRVCFLPLIILTDSV